MRPSSAQPAPPRGARCRGGRPPFPDHGMDVTMDTTEVLESYLDDYFDRMARLRYRDLARRQDGRLAGLAFGAAGVAYAHWHVALVRGEERLLDGARRWARAAWEHRAEPTAFFPAGRRPPRGLAEEAFLYGSVGVRFVRALVTAADGAGGGAPGRNDAGDAMDDVVAALRHPGVATDLYAGAAGRLLAASLLLAGTGEPRLRAPGRTLAAGLLRRSVEPRSRAGTAGDDRGPGLAHGTAGVLLALLSWHRAAATPPPGAVVRVAERLIDGALAEPARFCSRPAFTASLCNGFAGLAVLALEAGAALGTERCLEAARRAVRLALGAVPPRPDLCCGRAGVAAACLALATADPAGPWRRHARELVLSALLTGADDWEVSGLYGGEAALPCLAADLLAGAAGGPPALAWPPAARPCGVPRSPAVAVGAVPHSAGAPGELP